LKGLRTIDKGSESDTERREFSQAIKRVDLEVRYESYRDERIARLETSKAAHQPDPSALA
jgi:hypothetical protein